MTDHTHPPESPADVTPESPFTLPGFFAALEDGSLLAARCTECETRLVPPRPACYECGSRDVVIEKQPETGTVVSYTEVRRPAPALADDAPFTIAIVELDTGARLTGRLDLAYGETEIGLPVRLTVREPTEGQRELAREHEADWPIHVFESDR
jgi:uncharacterized OB-fold protein